MTIAKCYECGKRRKIVQSHIGRFTTYNYCKEHSDKNFPAYADLRPNPFEILTKHEWENRQERLRGGEPHGQAREKEEDEGMNRTYCLYCGKHHNSESEIAYKHATSQFPKGTGKRLRA